MAIINRIDLFPEVIRPLRVERYHVDELGCTIVQVFPLLLDTEDSMEGWRNSCACAALYGAMGELNARPEEDWQAALTKFWNPSCNSDDNDGVFIAFSDAEYGEYPPEKLDHDIETEVRILWKATRSQLEQMRAEGIEF